ncbi:MAG: type IV secretion system DNA-binding domain-containing protein [Bryobacterales bacterium]|nr:type IV secretion system DNA-binding domain-containing protein [Bryobacterales bacterium]
MTLGRQGILWVAGLAALARWRWDRWPAAGEVPALDLVAARDPALSVLLEGWHYAGPAAAVLILGSGLASLWDVWGPRLRDRRGAGGLPARPKASPREPLVVVGEQHHPVEPAASERPTWLSIPAKGLYTGVFVAGAVGSGKTSGCMRPFAEQVLAWRADDPRRRPSGLVLEVKGDFCHQVREILEGCGRGADYLELGLGGERSWNPLEIPEMDSYSLAGQLISLQSQLFGRGKEPFWDRAATQLMRWIIEVHRLPPATGWVTLRDLYRDATDLERFALQIDAAVAATDPAAAEERLTVGAEALQVLGAADDWDWRDEGGGRFSVRRTPGREHALRAADVDFELRAAREIPEGAAERAAELHGWFVSHWLKLDSKLRTSISEGVASLLSLFVDPEVSRVFCPPDPRRESGREGPEPLPPMREAIEEGRVVALNMPANAAPALARFVGVMLKTAWLRAALGRPAEMALKRNRGRVWRPALFLCDEYQSFATVGEDDPAGDEKAFALTRQARVIPLVATQSLSSLASATRGTTAWKTLLQCFRTRIFLALSDSHSARMAAEICGQVERLKESWSVSESGGRGGVSLLGGTLTAAKGGAGMGKSWSRRREFLFQPADFAELDNFQAIVQPFDGRRSARARRVYLKPHFLPDDLPYWTARGRGLL